MRRAQRDRGGTDERLASALALILILTPPTSARAWCPSLTPWCPSLTQGPPQPVDYSACAPDLDRFPLVWQRPCTSLTRPSILCSADSGPGPCVTGAEIAVVRSLHDALRVSVSAWRTGIYPDRIVIEVFPGEDGAITALVCQITTTDYATGRCQPIEPECAVSGTVTMPSFPTAAEEATALTVDVNVTLENGTTIVGHF